MNTVTSSDAITAGAWARQATEWIAGDLVAADLTDRCILGRYGASIGYCFIPWLAAVAAGARSALARDLAFNNLACEVHENHPFLLHDLLRSQGCLPARAHFEQMSGVLKVINTSWTERGSLTMLSLILLLEESAKHFLPLIARICDRRGAHNDYIRIHLAADVEHARLLAEAVEDERQYFSDSTWEIDTGFGLARLLLQNIFYSGDPTQGRPDVTCRHHE